jgi:hypothetical protein
LKQIEPPEKAFHAVADLDTEDLRAVVTHHLFAWHQQADGGGTKVRPGLAESGFSQGLAGARAGDNGVVT